MSDRLCRKGPAKAVRLNRCQYDVQRNRTASLTSTLNWSTRTGTIVAPLNRAVPIVRR